VTRVAGIDCGTNSIRLLIADASDDRSLTDVVREMRIVRLGQDVDRTGRLAPEAIERTRIACVEYAGLIEQHGAERVRMMATSASRDAENRDDFVAMVRNTLGVTPEVITGDEEARLSFRGASGGLPRVAEPILVADLGGGSTELVLGSGAEVVGAYSMDIGSVRMTERHLHDDPPTAAQIEAAAADINAAIDFAAQRVPLAQARTFVGVAGTITTVAAIAQNLAQYDSTKIHGAVLSARTIDEVADRLLHLTHEERAAIPSLHPGRVDVVGAGALILRTLMRRVGSDELLVSEHDILDGITLSTLEQPEEFHEQG